MLDSLTSVGGVRAVLAVLIILSSVWAFARGLFRMVLFAVSLAGGAAAAWAWWRWMPGILVPRVIQKISPDMVQWTSVAAGVAGLIVTRKLLGAILSGERPLPSGGAARLRSAGFSLIPALILLWAGAMAVRWTGAVGQLRRVDAAARSHSAAPLDEEPLSVRVSRNLSSGWLGNVLDRTDPLDSRHAGTLCAMVYLHSWAETYDKATLARLHAQPAARALLAHPAVKGLTNDSDVLAAMSFSRFSELVSLGEISRVLDQPGVGALVLAIDPAVVTRRALGLLPLHTPRAEVVE